MLRESVQNAPPVSIRGDALPEQAAKTILRVYPQGEARKLNQRAFEYWQDNLFLFSQVENMVIKVNQHFHAPFKLEEGKPSPLGLFVKSAFVEKPNDLPAGGYALEYHRSHKRSIILCRATFQDTDGRIYRDVDLKGIGHIDRDWYCNKPNTTNPGKRISDENYEGLLDRDIALYDYEMTEKFIEKGIRTCRALGIIELQEIIAKKTIRGKCAENPEKLSLEEAVNERILKENFHPVVEVRAFGTKFRALDITDSGSPLDERGQLMLEDAKKLVSQELGLEKTMSDMEYLEWFANTLGHNVGLMHKSGWEHHYLPLGHNITLDCRVVDLDSVRPLETPQNRLGELVGIKSHALRHFFDSVVSYQEVSHLIRIFNHSYDTTFHNHSET